MKYQDWSKFRLRCASLYEIMTHPKHCKDLTKKQVETREKLLLKPELTDREKETLAILDKKRARYLDPELSAAAINNLTARYSKEKYNKRVAASTIKKWTIAKGTALEDEAMKLLSKLHRIDYQRPLNPIENDYLIGKCDLLYEDYKHLVEMKISWSALSFFPYMDKPLPAKVWWQTQGYLELYDLPYALVCYVLVNTPRHLIDQEYANLLRRYTFGEIPREKFDEGMDNIEGFYNYDNIPTKRRVITFEVHRSPEVVPLIKRKIELSRVWLSEFDRKHIANKKIITLPEHYIDAGTEESNTEPDPDE